MTKSKKIAVCAVMIALALALSYIERFIPLQLVVPLPSVKMGLANIVTMIALYMLNAKFAYMILIPRCILGSVFGGGITGLAFSIFGGVLALGAMAAAKRIRWLSVYGVSILGAAAHNIGQILAAIMLMRSVYICAYLPYLMIASVFTGFATGFIGAGILRTVPSAFISAPLEMRR